MEGPREKEVWSVKPQDEDEWDPLQILPYRLPTQDILGVLFEWTTWKELILLIEFVTSIHSFEFVVIKMKEICPIWISQDVSVVMARNI